MTNGKVALVTGASRGIGRACAIKLGEAGYKVAVNYNSNEAAANEVVEKIKAAGSEAVAIKANVSDLAQVKTMMREVINAFGQLDVLVNNAGIVKDEFVLMMNPDTIDQCLDLNIKGYMYCTQQAVLKMFSKKQGVIVNVSSVSSKLAVPGQSVYSATKGAVNSMTATMAKELAPYGIRVNAVAPGFIATDMVEALPEDKKEEYFKVDFEEIPVHFPGTGDIFSAVFIGKLMSGKDLQTATAEAMDAVKSMIGKNADNVDKYKGIPLETCMEVLD